MHTLKLKTIAFCTLLLISQAGVYALEPQPLPVGSGTIADITITVPDPGFQLIHKPVGAKLYVKLYVKDKQYEIYDFNNIHLKFELIVTNSGQEKMRDTVTLMIDKKQPEQWLVYDFTSNDVSGYRFNLNNCVLAKNGAPAGLIPHIMMQAFVTVDYRISVFVQNDPPVKEPLSTGAAEIGTGSRVITLPWKSTYRYPAYQVQVLRLYNINPAYTDSMAIRATVSDADWSKALTLELYDDGSTGDDKSISIALIEGTGYYAWRVRPLGNYGKGVTTDPQNLGVWSSQGPDTLDISDSTQSITKNMFFYFKDPEENKSWSYTRVFSEKGKQKDIIQYATGLSYVQQTQTHMYSSDITLVTQAVVDYTGRVSLNSMPVPITEEKLSTFKTDFFRSSDNSLYTANNFDSDDKFNNPDKNFDDNCFSYYNGENSDLVPDAQQYAFSRVLYYNDGTGRVKEQTGVGKMHQMGTDAGGKTTRMYYTAPTEHELIALFGMEAPSAESVMKITTVDPNGIASVQYKAKDGKLLATAIQEKEEENPSLEPLDSPLNSLDEQVNKITIKSSDGFIVSKRFVLTHQVDTFRIHYTPPVAFFDTTIGCCNSNCAYDVSVVIYNIDKETVAYNSGILKITKGSEGIDDTITLADGEYLVVKKMALDSTADKAGPQTADGLREKLQPVIKVIKMWLGEKVASEIWTLDQFYAQVNGIPQTLNDTAYISYFQELIDDSVITGLDDPELMDKLGIEQITMTRDDKNSPEQIIIDTKCGVPITVNLTPDVPPFKCDLNAQADTAHYKPGSYNVVENKGLYDFEGYMWKQLNLTTETGKNIFYEKNMPGYNRGEFNKMAYHMLNDSYAEINGGTPQATTPKVHFNCGQIWPAWINAITMLKHVNGGNDGINLANSVDGQSDTLDDHFDDNYKPGSLIGKLLKPAMKIILSIKMRKHSNSHPVSTKIPLNLPYLFLKATGYKFARIVDMARPQDSYSTLYGVLSEDSTEYYDSRKKERFNKDLPRIRSAVFAFKYFEYTTADCQTCAENLNYNLHDPGVCEIEWGVAKLYANWNFTDRLIFYNCILNCPLPTEDDEKDPTLVADNCSNYPAEKQIQEARTTCEKAIDSRYNEYKQALTSAFVAEGYIIGGCEGDPKVITYEFIDSITAHVVEQAKQYCVLPVEEFSCVESDTVSSCVNFTPEKSLMIRLGSDENLAMMKNVMYGRISIDISIPPAPCTDTIDSGLSHIVQVRNGVVVE